MNTRKEFKKNIIWTLFFIVLFLSLIYVIYLLYIESLTTNNFDLIENALIVLTALIVPVLCCIAYLFIKLTKAYAQNSDSEKELTKATYLYRIQKILFDAHKKPELIKDALDIVAKSQNCEAAFLLNIRGRFVKKYYIGGRTNKDIQSFLDGLVNSQSEMDIYKFTLQQGKCITNYINTQNPDIEGDPVINKNLLDHNIKSIMLIPLMDENSTLESVLACVNLDSKQSDIDFLKNISINFIMAIKNIESYGIVCEMGTIDTLTGMQNQNSYHYALIDYTSMNVKSLCCVYIDANGLHEINNTLGHTAGDNMLKFVANCIKDIFGNENTYRVGGDEFVAIALNEDKATLEQKLDTLKKQTSDKMYDISIGVAWLGENTRHIDRLTDEAEQNMYTDKRLYYEKKGDIKKIRTLNNRLEKILAKKRDTDNFLLIIATYFMGVYVVDLNTDNIRCIYTPDYFESILKKSDYKFKPALSEYIEAYACDEDKENFHSFIRYPNIRKAIELGKVPEFRYKRPDGKNVLLRIYKPSQNNSNAYETFWLFEEFN